ncbi:hypothetical protein [Brevibacillus laterosporus]|nr:hypothetical protein [Brevibacillus laterosporus]MCG7320177.1 hypothetical protein [Brevibacillus laterosporus]
MDKKPVESKSKSETKAWYVDMLKRLGVYIIYDGLKYLINLITDFI